MAGACLLVALVGLSALAVPALPSCAEDVFKKGEWDKPETAPCIDSAGPVRVVHGTLGYEDDIDWLRVDAPGVPVEVQLAVRGDSPVSVFVVAPGLPPAPAVLSAPPGTGAVALPSVPRQTFRYLTFLRAYRRVALGRTPAASSVLIAVTGGPADYLLSVGTGPGFTMRGLVSWPGALFKEWLSAHD